MTLSELILRPECVLVQPDARQAALPADLGEVDPHDHVPPHSRGNGARGEAEPPPLPPGHEPTRLEPRMAPALHLDQREDSVTLDDEIELDARDADPPPMHAPSAQHEPGRDGLLGKPTAPPSLLAHGEEKARSVPGDSVA